MDVIKVKNLSKKYDGLLAVDNITFSVEEGDFFGFIGPNGAGKTTTIKAMLGLLRVSSGEIDLLDKNIRENQFQEFIGYVPGEANLYDNLTAWDQINYFARFYKNIDQKYLKYLKEIFKIDGKRKIATLSLGNKKKVAIVCALLNRPKLLLFDEVSNSLDPLMQKVLFDELQRLNREGTTIFFSSHNLEEVQIYCRNVAIIREGKIIAIDNVEKLIEGMGVEVRIKTSQKLDEDYFKKNNIRLTSLGENSVSFIYKKDINELVKLLSNCELVSARITDVKLENIFVGYFNSEKSKK
jgi:ABC-2 type transport system ATP-binding protein